jgi:CRISPR/Cas system-associated exonuclease Cas4 (RecB family)
MSGLKNLLKRIKGAGLDAVEFSLKPVPADMQHEHDTEALFFQAAFKPPKRSVGVFSPSELSVETPICPRKMYFRRAKVAHDPGVVNFAEADNRMMRIVDLGTMIHMYIQVNLMRAGMLIAREVPVESARYGIKGSCDGLVYFEGTDTNKRAFKGEIPLEIKSINLNGYSSLKTAKPEHLRQASIYSDLLGYDQTLFLYYCKDNSEMKLYVVDNDHTFLDMFYDLAETIVQHHQAQLRKTRTNDITRHELPPRICGTYNCERAVNCPYGKTCFSI